MVEENQYRYSFHNQHRGSLSMFVKFWNFVIESQALTSCWHFFNRFLYDRFGCDWQWTPCGRITAIVFTDYVRLWGEILYQTHIGSILSNESALTNKRKFERSNERQCQPLATACHRISVRMYVYQRMIYTLFFSWRF